MIIYEINARVYGKHFDQITDQELQQLADLGYDWVWFMGIWSISDAGREISRRQAADFEGSPYAITEYQVNPDLGGETAFRQLVQRAHNRGLKVMADFVPNHMAVDSPLIDSNPEYFIHSNPDLRPQKPQDYFWHRRGIHLAHGRDPYFDGWTDTVQLDYVHPGLRTHQIETLKWMANLVDGLRCDMAMLVLREQIKNQWFPAVDWQTFDRYMPHEFWSEAIGTVKQLRPDFVFMAEVYWDKEPYLQQLGFDLTYNKKLYDLLAHNHHPDEIAGYLRATPNDYLARSVHFLENHDEERAMTRFGARSRAAAVLSFAIIGVPFVHQGQMEGFVEKLPVQRLRPLQPENSDKALAAFYEKLLQIVRAPIFRQGEMRTLGTSNGLVLVERRYQDQQVLVGVDTGRWSANENPTVELDLNYLNLAGQTKARDLWTGKVIDVVKDGRFVLPTGAITGWAETGAFLLQFEQ